MKESPSYSTVKKRRESSEDDRWSGRPKDAITDENVKVMHTLVMYDRRRDLRSIASETGQNFCSSTINPNHHLRYVKSFSKMGAVNVNR